MLGLMQDWPLLCHRDHRPRRDLSCATARSSRARSRGRCTARPTRRSAGAPCGWPKRLDRDGIRLGDRVATLAWNTWRHLETWYGIIGIGAIYHTVNPRLFPDQIAWIINHAEDRVMFTDLTFVPLLEKLADKLPTIERYIVLTDAAHMPQTTLRNAVALRGVARRGRRRFRLESVRREHRRRHVLHLRHHRQSEGRALFAPLQRAARVHGVAAGRDGPVRRATWCMPVVPMFHANGWSLAFSAPMAGATLVMPGREARRRLDLRAARDASG